MYSVTVKQHGKVISRARGTNQEETIDRAKHVAQEQGAKVGYAEMLVYKDGRLIDSEDVIF